MATRVRDRARAEAHGRTIRETTSIAAARKDKRAPGRDVSPKAQTRVGVGDPQGAIGNQNISGWLTGEDYNRDLDGPQAMAVYDEMRKGHGQIRASLALCKGRIKGATFRIKPASDETSDQAIADFVTAALLDDDAMDAPFSSVVDNALLKLDFGASAHEKVWRVDEHGALRLQRLMPLLPKTFYRWFEDLKTGRLSKLEQYAPKNGQYGFWEIESDRLVHHIHQREGNNFFGVSLLRSAYPHWWYIKQLYRIAAVSADREHQGIPIARLGEKYNANAAPIDKLEETLKGLRSYDRAYLIEPYGVTYDWLTSKNTGERMTGLLELVEHHVMMIARSVLQGFSAQGEQRHGSFGAASITYDAFQDAEQSTAAEICTELRSQVIKPLCEVNFVMNGRKTPTLVLDRLGKPDAGVLSEAAAKLATSSVITPDDEMEDYLRSIIGAPPMPATLRGRDRSRTAVPPLPDQLRDPQADPNTPPVPGKPAPAKAGRSASPESDAIEAARKARYSERGREFAREPTIFERDIFDLHSVASYLDDECGRLVHQLTEVRQAHIETVARHLAKKDAQASGFTGLRLRALPAAPTVAIRKAFREMQERVFGSGREALVAELTRQELQAGQGFTLADPSTPDSRAAATSALVSSAEATAERLASTWQQLALENAQRLRRAGLIGEALASAIEAALLKEIERGLARAAGEEVNEAFGLGRTVEAAAHADEIERCTYSCVLDAHSCFQCIGLDGREFTLGTDEYFAHMPPYVACEGRDSCRCVYLYTLKPVPPQ